MKRHSMTGSVVAYSGRTAVLPTKHGMLGQIAPAMRCELEVEVVGIGALTHGAEQKFVKGIRQSSDLVSAMDSGDPASANRKALVMADFRAPSCPARLAVFAAAAERLDHRVASSCRECGAAGLGRIDTVRGTPCRGCR